MRITFVVVGVIGVAALTYLSWQGPPGRPTDLSPFEGAAEAVTLKVVAHTQQDSGQERYEFEYEEGAQKTRFALEVEALNHQPTEESPFTVTSGALLRVPGSQPAAMLNALGRLHRVPVPDGLPAQLQSLQIDVAILAVGAAINPSDWNVAGRYSTKEPGNWLVTKLFIPVPAGDKRSDDDEEEDDCEVFFAINNVDGIAEFVAKDSSYGRLLLAALSQIV